MAMADIQVLLSYYSMTEDLNPNPTTELEKIVNDLRIKYRTYVVDLDVEYGMVVLPTLFVHDFGDELGRYATLVDRNYNEFEVLVERNNGRIYLTIGWHALKDFFNVCLGSWVSMVYVGRGKFGIYLKDRFGGKVSTPRFNPPMKFELERQMLPFHEFDVLPSPFAHDNFNFEFSYEKRLTSDDYESGSVELAYMGFCQATLDIETTSLKVVDDNGNVWGCTLMYNADDGGSFKIGGGWRRMVLARRLRQ